MAFWKPGASAPGLDTVERGTGVEQSAVAYNRNENLSLMSQRRQLPIYKNRDHFLYLVENHQVTVIVGETGSGKTTQLPQYLHEAGWTSDGKVVACTQPRRIAATTVAARVAEEQGVLVGDLVGHHVRFDCKVGSATRMVFMTDGMLVRQTMQDPLLSRFSVIMVDEAHERSLYTDILLGLLKKILRKRTDLRVIVSSATLVARDFSTFFTTPNTSVGMLSVEGRQWPVDVLYLATPAANYQRSCVETVVSICKNEPAGHVLVFCTGQQEVEHMLSECAELLRLTASASNQRPQLLPMYAGLPYADQLKVFKPVPRHTRKVIFATNIAETSITIDGVVYVVDPLFAKLRSYDPRSNMESLVEVPISQASAKQRAGRAGRVRAGKAFRLCTEAHFEAQLPAVTPPEMQRCNLSTVVLQLKALGIDDVLHFDFLSPPPAETMMRALELLYSLGGLDDSCKLTQPMGRMLVEMPVEPMLGRVLLESGEYGCSEEMLTIAAMLSVQHVYFVPPSRKHESDRKRKKFAVKEGDHLTLLNVYTNWLEHPSANWCRSHFVNPRALKRAREIRAQLRKYLVRFKVPLVSCGEAIEVVQQCVVAGFFANAAKRHVDGSYRTVRGNDTLHIHPHSCLFAHAPEWVVFHEMVLTNKKYMRDVLEIDPKWLVDLAPHYYERKTLVLAPGLRGPAPPRRDQQ